MPDVVGQQLDVALSDIERAGYEDDVEILGGGTFGVINESNWVVCEQLPSAGEEISEPRLSVDRECEQNDDEAEEDEDAAPAATAAPTTIEALPSTTSTAPPPATTAPSPETTTATTVPPTTDAPSDTTPVTTEPYTYDGPEYEIVARDPLPIGLTEFFVLIDPLDYSNDSYKEQIKSVITDVARTNGTATLVVDVVTDIEIALLESFSSTADFYAEYGDDYVNNVVLPKEETGWVASYTGGFDFDEGELSSADSAFEVVWFPAGNPEFEKWKPVWD